MAKLTDLMIQFTVGGEGALMATLSAVRAGLDKLSKGIDAVGKFAESAFAKAKAYTMSWVTAGIAASDQGQILSFHMERLSRVVAGLFGVEIRKATELLGDLTNKLASLSDSQRETIANWVKGVGAGLLVVAVLPKITAGLVGMAAATKAAAMGFVGLKAAFMSGGVLGAGLAATLGVLAAGLPIGIGLAAGAAAGGAGGEGGFDPLGEMFKVLQPILEAVKPAVEAIGEAFKLMMPALKEVAKSLGESLARVFQALAPVLPHIARAIGALLMAVTPLIAPLGRIVAALAEALAPVLKLVADLVTVLAVVLKPFVWILEKLANVIEWTVGIIGKAINWLKKQATEGWIGNLASLGLRSRVAAAIPTAGTPKATEERKAPGGRGELAGRTVGFEQVEAIWTRLAQASIRMGGGKTVDDEQLEELRNIREENKETNKHLARQRPMVAR